MRVIIVLLSLSLGAVAGVPANQRIVGGTVTTIDQYPQIAALLYSWNTVIYSQSCCGIILNPRTVLTAAHCSDSDPPSAWRVRVGSTYASSGGIVHNLRNFILHPNYDRRFKDYDLALMYTATSIVMTSVVQRAAIAGPNYYLGDNQVVWAAGWGSTFSGGRHSEQLRHVQVWTVNLETCKARYTNVNYVITDNMLCSGWLDVGGRDQCQGDSGGPLLHYGVVVGVCSFGHFCGRAGHPGVNMKVSRFTDWIENNAQTVIDYE